MQISQNTKTLNNNNISGNTKRNEQDETDETI